MKLVSFDIFDTVLIRKCGLPENIFYLLAKRLYPQDHLKQADFLVWRRHAEHGLAAKQPNVSLEEIYLSCNPAVFPEYSIEELKQAELDIESENLIANPAIRDKIQALREQNSTIVFISDMYLPANFLKKILIREKCCLAQENVFVSCEQGARKDNGRLYEVVRQKLQPEEWRHFGDNAHSDIQMAHRHHITASRIHTNFTDTEKRFISTGNHFRDPYELSILAGVSRAARLTFGNTPEARFAADFIIPAYIPYIFYILNYAKKENIKQVYFLSRDGYILHAGAIALKTDLTMKDLFVSRRSLLLPYLAGDFSKKAYLQIIDRHTLIRKKVSKLLWQLQLDRSELQEKFQIRFTYEQILTPEQEKHFLDALFHSSFSYELKKLAEKKLILLMKYFKETGLLNGDKSLLTDIGWLGTTRLMINDILTRAGMPIPEYIYYGIRGDVYPCNIGRYESYFAEGKLSTCHTALIENYYSVSQYASTVGYREEAGKISPVWDDTTLDNDGKNPVKLHEEMFKWAIDNMSMMTFSAESLFAWAQTSLAGLELDDIDFSPLTRIANFDNNSFVRKLSLPEIAKIACGMRVTEFDRGSLQLTLGSNMVKLILKIHAIAISCLYPIYRRWKTH